MVYFKNKFWLIPVLILGVLMTSGAACQKQEETIEPITLNWWRIDSNPADLSEIISGFEALYPHIRIVHQSFKLEEYKNALLEAWAEDKGPDIFSIPNTWLSEYETKIVSRPQEIVFPHQIMVGTIQKKPKIVLEKKPAPNLRALRTVFVDQAVKDIMRDGKIYDYPLSFDTLVLFYNRDLLNRAKISIPPKDWQDFSQQVSQLTLTDRTGKFIQSGVSLGTAENVNYFFDLLSLLMMQNGTKMVDERGQVVFNQPLLEDQSYFPGQEALRFYTDFAKPGSEIYSWNKEQINNLEAFSQGRVAFYFGYSEDVKKIKELNPKLNFEIAKMPQITGTLKEVNFARYYLETTAKKSKYPNEAWAFLEYAASPTNAKTYQERAKKPTAHRALIQAQLEDYDLEVFVSQVLSAENWYQGKKYSLTEEIFQDMINKALLGEEIPKVIDEANAKVNLIF